MIKRQTDRSSKRNDFLVEQLLRSFRGVLRVTLEEGYARFCTNNEKYTEVT